MTDTIKMPVYVITYWESVPDKPHKGVGPYQIKFNNWDAAHAAVELISASPFIHSVSGPYLQRDEVA